MVAWLQTRTVNCWIKLQDNASMFHDNDMQLDSACRTNKLQSQHCLQKHQCMSLIQVAKRCDEGVQVSYFLSLRHVRDSVFTANMSYSFSLWFHCLSVENKLQKLWRQSRIWAFDFWIDVNCQHLSFHDSLTCTKCSNRIAMDYRITSVTTWVTGYQQFGITIPTIVLTTSVVSPSALTARQPFCTWLGWICWVYKGMLCVWLIQGSDLLGVNVRLDNFSNFEVHSSKLSLAYVALRRWPASRWSLQHKITTRVVCIATKKRCPQ